MKLRIIKPEGMYAVGDIIEPDMPDVARLLILRGIAEPVPEPPDVPAGIVPPNKLMQPAKVRTK